jgi:transcriptional regulator with XRE-family HTH domain
VAKEAGVPLQAEQDLSPELRLTTSGLGDWIRVARTVRGISQRALAGRSGLSRSYLSEIESGHGGQPSLATLDKLAAALDTSRTELMRAAGYINTGEVPTSDLTELQLLTLFRDLSTPGRISIIRFIRFVHAEEHRWIQPELELPTDDPSAIGMTSGPSLFDAVPLRQVDGTGSG